MSARLESLVADFAARFGALPSSSEPGASAASGQVTVQMLDFSRRGLHWEAVLPAERVVDAGRWFAERGFALDTITGLDWLAEAQMEVVYDFFHPVHFWRAAVRTRVPRAQPELPTLSEVFPGAAWHERETHDFFGIRFVGHPNLTPLLLPEDAQFHPLRKDFTP